MSNGYCRAGLWQPKGFVSRLATDRFAGVTRPLPLRAELPADDATIVLRSGVMGADNVTRAAERTFTLYAVYASRSRV